MKHFQIHEDFPMFRLFYFMRIDKVYSSQIQLRSGITQQLKDLKSLEECSVLTKEQFEEQRNKLLKEMSNI